MGCCASSTASTGAAFAKGKGQAQTLGANPQNTIPGVDPSKDAAIQRARSKSGGSKAASLGSGDLIEERGEFSACVVAHFLRKGLHHHSVSDESRPSLPQGIAKLSLEYFVMTDILAAVKDWTESSDDSGQRAWRWRLQLGLLNSDSATPSLFTAEEDFASSLDAQVNHYRELKKECLPDINKFEVDPLSSMTSGQDEDAWSSYYKDLELLKFIRGDLDRLYVDDIDESFFQDESRKEVILNVLFVWAVRNKEQGAYRQGMHELVAFIEYVVETEEAYLKGSRGNDSEGSSSSRSSSRRRRSSSGGGGVRNDSQEGADRSAFLSCAVRAKLVRAYHETTRIRCEAFVFAIFDRLMTKGQLVSMYDPAQASFALGFCDKVQKRMLFDVDPRLVEALDGNEVEPNLYGLRWSRLLFGRELRFQQTLILWDHLFGSFSSKSTTLLEAVQQTSVAMLLRLRNVLIRSDMGESMAVLMRFPPLSDSDFEDNIIGVSRQLRDGTLSLTIPDDDGVVRSDDEFEAPPSTKQDSTGRGTPRFPRLDRMREMASNIKMPQVSIPKPSWLSGTPWKGSETKESGNECNGMQGKGNVGDEQPLPLPPPVVAPLSRTEEAGVSGNSNSGGDGELKSQVARRLEALAIEYANHDDGLLGKKIRGLANVLSGTSTLQAFDNL